MQRIYIDRGLVPHPTRAALSGLAAPDVAVVLGTELDLGAYYFRNSTQEALAGSSTGKLTIKIPGARRGAALFIDNTMVAEGSGPATFYKFGGVLAGEALENDLGELDSKVYACTISWTEPGKAEDKCLDFSILVYNSSARPEDVLPPTVDTRWEWLKDAAPTANGFVHDDEVKTIGVGAPSDHASSHGAGGGDPITIAQSQVTDLGAALAGKVPVTLTVNGKALSGNISITKADVGLGSAENTSDAGKPISTLTQTALNAKADTNRKLDDFGTPDDNTDLDATTGRHGLLPKLGGGTTNFLRADGSWAAPSGGGGGAVLTGNTVWLDVVNGNNGTGVRGRFDLPFLAVASALAAATSGDTIELRGGSYAVTATALKNGVDLVLSPKAILSRTIIANTTLQGVLDDLGAAVVAKVIGGTITLISNAQSPNLSSDSGAIMVAHSSSNVRVEVDKITVQDTGADEHKAAIWQSGGKLWVAVKEIVCSGSSAFGIWWENGELYARGEKLVGNTYGIWIAVDTTPTGDMYCRFDLIEATGPSNGWPFYNRGTNANARCWIDCFVLKSSSGLQAINNQGNNKVYIHAQKIYGDCNSFGVGAASGYLEVRAAKMEAVANQNLVDLNRALFLYVDAGRVLWNVQDHDAKNFSGWGFHFDGGVTTVRGAEWTASAGVVDQQRVTCSQPLANNTGFDLPGPFTVRFDIDSGGASGDLVVAISSTDDGNAVAAALVAAWTNTDWTVALPGGTGNHVDFTAAVVGVKAPFVEAGSGFTFSHPVNGFTHSGIKVESGDVEFIDCTFDLTHGTEAVFVINGGNVRLRNCRIRGAVTDIELNGGTCQVEGGSGTGNSGNFVLVENSGTVEFLSPV